MENCLDTKIHRKKQYINGLLKIVTRLDKYDFLIHIIIENQPFLKNPPIVDGLIEMSSTDFN